MDSSDKHWLNGRIFRGFLIWPVVTVAAAVTVLAGCGASSSDSSSSRSPAADGSSVASQSPTATGSSVGHPTGRPIPPKDPACVTFAQPKLPCSGEFAAISGSQDGTALGWLRSPRQVTVILEPVPGTAFSLAFAMCGIDSGNFTVSGQVLEPVAGSQISSANACFGEVNARRQLLYGMLKAQITYQFSSPTELTLTGAGLVLHFKATN